MKSSISEEKRQWMKDVGMIENKSGEYGEYALGVNHFYSENYIKNTPLKILKEKYEKNKDLVRLN